MRKVHLHGALAKYGETFDLDVLTAGEAVVALCTNFPAMRREIARGSWVVMRGDPETGMCLDEQAIVGMRLGTADLHIMPEIAGAKNSRGMLKAVVGVALFAVSFGSAPFLSKAISASLGSMTWGNAIGQIGFAMALGGVSSMLAPETQIDSSDEDRSYTMTGPTSQYGQGQAVQIVYGDVITGGMLVSGGVDADGLEAVTEAPVVTPTPTWVANNPNNQK